MIKSASMAANQLRSTRIVVRALIDSKWLLDIMEANSKLRNLTPLFKRESLAKTWLSSVKRIILQLSLSTDSRIKVSKISTL